MEEFKEEIVEVSQETKSRLEGFITFIREQGVVGLAVGFILGGAVSKIVSSLVDDVINPLIGLILGGAGDLKELVVNIGGTTLKYGSFIATMVDFAIIAAVVYFVFEGLGLDRLDKKKG